MYDVAAGMYVIHENDLGCRVKRVLWDHVHTCIYSIDNTIIMGVSIITSNELIIAHNLVLQACTHTRRISID